MSTDRYRAPTDPHENAYEDAWYRALKAKASRRFADPEDDTTDTPQVPAFPPAPAQDEGDAAAR
jgi:hypothetical protein